MKIYNVLIALAIAIAVMLLARAYIRTSAANRTNVTNLANPGTLNLTQLGLYRNCDPATLRYSSTPSYSTSTCKTGEMLNMQGDLIVKSINQNNSVSFYEYRVPNAMMTGELFSPEVVTYSMNEFLLNACGLSISISGINYNQQNFSVIEIRNSSAGGCQA